MRLPSCELPAACAACRHLLPLPAEEVVVDQREVVPGDCVRLFAGEMLPGDVRVLRAKDLFVG